MDPVELISRVRSGVVQVLTKRGGERVGSGSAFLVRGGLATNSHVLRRGSPDTILLRLADTDAEDPESYIRLSVESCDKVVVAESRESERDYVCLKLWEQEFNGRYVFEFAPSDALSVGEQIVFLGFPFGMAQLTAHVGHVASIHEKKGVEIIQIHGSVNGGNSGGPLLDLKSGRVAGIVTRAVTGLIEEQFEELIEALRQNQAALGQVGAVMTIGGINLMQAIQASQAAMERIAQDLWRSANVGIGFAYSARYVRDEIHQIGE